MFTFILKSLIVTVCATGGYLVAARLSLKWAKEWMSEYMNMLEEKDIL